jgi:hypothetical protein
MQKNRWKCLLTFSLVLLFLMPAIPISGLADDYSGHCDLLIITHEDFVEPCNQLADWKSSTGLPSAVVTWQDLSGTYSGCDRAEKIKRGIEDWHRTRCVKYVLLMGDANKLPVRFITMGWHVHTPDDDNSSDIVYSVSDLYYADLYNNSEGFDDWDYYDNGHYGELLGAWRYNDREPINCDRIDMYPDVAVGRVPASDVAEAQYYVDKVITYETGNKVESQDWLKRVILVVSGVDDLGQYDFADQIESKLLSGGWEVRKLYDVNPLNRPRPFSLRPDGHKINLELAAGRGLLNFIGHGRPLGAPGYGITGDNYQVCLAMSNSTAFDRTFCPLDSFCPGMTGESDVGDFDGDGDFDLFFFGSNGSVYTSQNPYHYNLYDFRPVKRWNLGPHFIMQPGRPYVGDFDGDGADDLVRFNFGNGEVYVAKSNGTGYPGVEIWSTDFSDEVVPRFVGDFNGDDMDDVACIMEGEVYIGLSIGNSFASKFSWFSGVADTWQSLVVGDFNGDSMDDIAFFDVILDNVSIAFSGGQMFQLEEPSTNLLSPGDLMCGAEIAAGDFDGNGIDDIVVFYKDSRIGGDRYVGDDRKFLYGDVEVFLRDEYGFFARDIWHDGFCVGNQISGVGDFNHDGKTDAIQFTRGPAENPFDELDNVGMYPIVFASACSTAEYSIIPPWHDYTDINGINRTGSNNGNIFSDGRLHYQYIKLAPPPATLQPFDQDCLAEKFLVEFPDKGAIAYIGGVEVLQSGYMTDLNHYFIESYCSGGQILGDMWNDALETYLNHYHIGKGEHSMMADDWGDVVMYQHPSKMALFGDPSLRVFLTPAGSATSNHTTAIIVIGGIFVGCIVAIPIIRRIRRRP